MIAGLTHIDEPDAAGAIGAISSTSLISRHGWEESSSQDTDDRYDDHEFNEGKSSVSEFHGEKY
jgi:hypothetical protein